MQQDFSNPIRRKRRFLPEDFKMTYWASLQPFYDQLLQRNLNTVADVRQWFIDRSELEGAIAEDAGWRYINMTCDTASEAYRKHYETYIKDILPNTIAYAQQLNTKVVACPHTASLEPETGFALLLRCLRNSISLYRAENVPLITQLKLREREYAAITGAMTVTMEGDEMTLQQAARYFEGQNRKLREQAFLRIYSCRRQAEQTLNELYTDLVQARDQIARNADFPNFRDYTFVTHKRFDYTPQDCFDFHQGVEETVIPCLTEMAQEKKQLLGVEVLRPWDHDVDPGHQLPLQPFSDAEDLLQKTITVFDRLDVSLGNCLRTMQARGHFDLDSRKDKAPGGYNFPLRESGAPFIFMNQARRFKDMTTLLHEGGHALHAMLMHDVLLNDFKEITSEMAELASMSMELITMDHWDVFFDDPVACNRAKKKQLEDVIRKLAWIAAIDQFQHWVYENPYHSPSQRNDVWYGIMSRFSDQVTEWGEDNYIRFFVWQQQLHLFEVPFYYIEYGIAQLGAIALWRNYQQNPKQVLQDYLKALKLGYTHSLPEMYKAAGIKLDFSRDYIRELVHFAYEQWKAL
ncbi:MAG: M3 family oligoendopeptidase [Bacteroidota bacterium]